MDNSKDKLPARCRLMWEKAGKGKWLLAVSGGADSTALLIACRKAGIPFDVAHCNFNLRGRESVRDMEFVKALCQEAGTECLIKEWDMRQETAKGESTEMACRRVRYRFFRTLKNERGYTRIVLAHNASDNVETFFMNALRGSGSRGLKGMEADSGELVRPLLAFTRDEILDFLAENEREFVTDHTNLESDYRRNYLRNEVFPLLESRWDGFMKAVTNTIEIQRRENRILEHFIALALAQCRDEKSGLPLLHWSTLGEFPDAVTLIYRFIEPYGGSSANAEEMARSARRPSGGKRWEFPGGHSAVFTGHGILIENNVHETYPYPIPLHAEWEKINPKDVDINKIKASPLTEAFFSEGADMFEWMRADRTMRISPLGMKGTTTVWKVLKENGLSQSQREGFQVLTDKKSGEAVWLPGIKRSRKYLVTESCTTIHHVILAP